MDDERTVTSDSIYQHYMAKQKSLHNIETKELVRISKDSRFHSSPESSPSFITSRHVPYQFVQSRVNSWTLFVWSHTDTSMGRLFSHVPIALWGDYLYGHIPIALWGDYLYSQTSIAVTVAVHEEHSCIQNRLQKALYSYGHKLTCRQLATSQELYGL